MFIGFFLVKNVYWFIEIIIVINEEGNDKIYFWNVYCLLFFFVSWFFLFKIVNIFLIMVDKMI